MSGPQVVADSGAVWETVGDAADVEPYDRPAVLGIGSSELADAAATAGRMLVATGSAYPQRSSLVSSSPAVILTEGDHGRALPSAEMAPCRFAESHNTTADYGIAVTGAAAARNQGPAKPTRDRACRRDPVQVNTLNRAAPSQLSA